MLDIRIVIGIFAILHSANGACPDCKGTYDDAEKNNNTMECNAVKDYVNCLEEKLNNASCESEATIAEGIQGDLGACDLSTACTCQKDFFKAVTTCSTAKARISCLKGKTEKACDRSTNVITLATATETYINGVGSCPLSGTTCECEVTYAKADISSNGNKCTALKNEISCLVGKTGNACDGSTTVSSLSGTVANEITGTSGCTLSGTTCECEVTFAKADISSNANICTALKNEISCLVGKTGNACDDSTPVSTLSATVANNITGTSGCIVDENCQCEIDYVKTVTSANKCSKTKALATCIQYEYDNGCGSERTRDKIGSYIQTTITDLGNSTCPVTETCQCQIDFAKASVTSAQKCSSARAFSICIGNVNNATEFGCDGVTVQDFIKTNSSAIQKEFCSASGLPVASLLLVLPAALFYL